MSGTACEVCAGSGRNITEDNFRPCDRCGGDGAWRPFQQIAEPDERAPMRAAGQRVTNQS